MDMAITTATTIMEAMEEDTVEDANYLNKNRKNI